MNEESENIIAILQRLEKIEKLLERMDRESRNEEARKAAFDVKWDQLMKEHSKIQEHVKENWERINKLEDAPVKQKAQLWDTFTGRAIILIGTAIGTAILTKVPSILKLLVEAKTGCLAVYPDRLGNGGHRIVPLYDGDYPLL